MTLISKVDHVTYACAQGMIEKWAWFHIEVEGGKLVTRIDDVDPNNPQSSMKLWCIDYGEFGIALIEGIDRARKSQVTLYVDRHGDHSIQHVAYEVKNLNRFTQRLQAYNCAPLGEPMVKRDAYGILKQLFCKGYSQLKPAETAFAEYVQRPRGLEDEFEITFSQTTGAGFYRQIEAAMYQEEITQFTDFSAMPESWNPIVVEQDCAKTCSSEEELLEKCLPLTLQKPVSPLQRVR